MARTTSNRKRWRLLSQGNPPLIVRRNPLRKIEVKVRPFPAAPRTAAEVMTSDVIALSAEAGVAEVARVMVERAVKHVPIVSAGRLVGMVARRDVLRVLARKDELIASDLETLFGHEALVLGPISVDVSDGIVTLDGPRDPRDRRLAQVLTRSVPGVVAVRFAD